MGNIKQSILAGVFSIITIGILTFLTYKTEFGIFLLASFGSSMVLLYGYPESPFAQPKNVFFGHLVTAIVGLIVLHFVPLPLFITIPLAVGFGVGLMIFLDLLIEPIAPVLDFWAFDGGEAPLQNYIGWVVVALFLQSTFHYLKVSVEGWFPHQLYLLQIIFFTVLLIKQTTIGI